jgi:hypothetical protein
MIVSPHLDFIGLIFEDSEKSEGIINSYLSSVKV